MRPARLQKAKENALSSSDTTKSRNEEGLLRMGFRAHASDCRLTQAGLSAAIRTPLRDLQRAVAEDRNARSILLIYNQL